MMSIAEKIEKKMNSEFDPEKLEVIDESHLHAGHVGHSPDGETHFRVKVVSHNFTGKNRLQRHRMINDLLADELAGGVHALAIRAAAPDEAE